MYAAATPHDPIREIYPGVFLLHGSIRMGPGMRMNRNMIILKEETEITLINPVRLNDAGLAELDALGDVKRIIRLGDFHGLDDEFYLDRYTCEFWAQDGQATYKSPSPSRVIRREATGPVRSSEYFIFETARYPEAALLLKEHKLLITTDSVQYHSDWSYFSWFTKLAFKMLGFKIGLNIGGPWLKRVTPEGRTLADDFERLMALDFDALIAAHGSLLERDAKTLLEREVNRLFR